MQLSGLALVLALSLALLFANKFMALSFGTILALMPRLSSRLLKRQFPKYVSWACLSIGLFLQITALVITKHM